MWKRTYFWILSTLVFFPFPAHRCYFFLPACICRTGLAFPKHENAVTKGITRACNEDQSSALVSEIRAFFPYRFIRKPWAHGHFSAVTLNSPLDSAAFPTIISPFALYYHPDTFPYFLVSCFLFSVPHDLFCSPPFSSEAFPTLLFFARDFALFGYFRFCKGDCVLYSCKPFLLFTTIL